MGSIRLALPINSNLPIHEILAPATHTLNRYNCKIKNIWATAPGSLCPLTEPVGKQAFLLFEFYIAQDELDGPVAVVFVDLGLIGDIKEFLFLEFILERAHVKADAAHRAGTVAD